MAFGIDWYLSRFERDSNLTIDLATSKRVESLKSIEVVGRCTLHESAGWVEERLLDRRRGYTFQIKYSDFLGSSTEGSLTFLQGAYKKYPVEFEGFLKLIEEDSELFCLVEAKELHQSIIEGKDRRFLKMLRAIEKGQDELFGLYYFANSTPLEGYQFLFILRKALECRRAELAKFLIEQDREERPGLWSCVLELAIEFWQLEVVEAILKNKNFYVPRFIFHRVLKTQDLEMIDLFLQSERLPSYEIGCALVECARANRLRCVARLVEKGPFDDLFQFGALDAAKRNGHVEIVEFLKGLGFVGEECF